MAGLENKVIISTRPFSDNDTIKDELIKRGAILLEMPMLEIVPANINEDIKKAILELNSYKWLIFTSKNGAEIFFNILKVSGISKLELRTTRIAVIGKKTAQSVIGEGIEPYLVSTGNTSEDFLEELKQHIQHSDNVLLAFGDLADSKIENVLSPLANVTRINVYETKQTKFYSKEIINKIKKDNYDIIIFTSPSGFVNFIDIMGKEGMNSGFRIACIGKTTEKEILKQGYKPSLVSSKPDGVIFAGEIEEYLSTGNLLSRIK